MQALSSFRTATCLLWLRRLCSLVVVDWIQYGDSEVLKHDSAAFVLYWHNHDTHPTVLSQDLTGHRESAHFLSAELRGQWMLVVSSAQHVIIDPLFQTPRLADIDQSKIRLRAPEDEIDPGLLLVVASEPS